MEANDSVYIVTQEYPTPHYPIQTLSTKYRIAGNFRGPYISRIAIKFIFAETNFVDCMIKATPTQVFSLIVGCEVYD